MNLKYEEFATVKWLLFSFYPDLLNRPLYEVKVREFHYTSNDQTQKFYNFLC
jgi:hypothetical protein